MSKRIYRWVFLIGALTLLFFLFGGFALDDLRLAPFFGFRMEWAKPTVRRVALDTARYQCDTVRYEIEEGGAGGIGVNVSLIRDGKTLLQVGGNESTFVGFRDIDGDGVKEVLATCNSRWAEKGVWKATSTGFSKINGNFKATAILFLAGLLMHGPLGVMASIILIGLATVGVLGCRRREATTVTTAPQPST